MWFPPAFTHESGAVHHDTFGEPDVNTGSKEMENKKTQVHMMLMFGRKLQEQHAMSEVVVAVERLVQQHEQFNGKGVSYYLQDYKVEMPCCSILEGL